MSGRKEVLADGVELWCGDCLDVMPGLSGIDLIAADLPYGTTQNSWDSVVPLDLLWPLYWKAVKDTGVVALNAAQPFTSLLITSQLRHFKYDWIWRKSRPTGHMNAKKQPLREHESICVFYRGQPTYNPQFTSGAPNHVGSKPRVKSLSGNYGAQYEVVEEYTSRKYPKTILEFPVVSPSHVLHPTQKPVGLLEYVIRTYTDAGQTVLDNAMGSGTTGIAAIALGRKFVGIEKDQSYFDAAARRIEAALRERPLP